MPYSFLERNWVYIIIGELWRYKNETLHAFLQKRRIAATQLLSMLLRQ